MMQELEYPKKHLTQIIERLADALTGLDEKLAEILEELKSIRERLNKPILIGSDFEYAISLINLGKALGWSRVDEFTISFDPGEAKEVILSTEGMVWRPNFIGAYFDYRKTFNVDIYIDYDEFEWHAWCGRLIPTTTRELYIRYHERVKTKVKILAQNIATMAQDAGVCLYRIIMPKEIEDLLEAVYEEYLKFLKVEASSKRIDDISFIEPQVRVEINLSKLHPNSIILKSLSELKETGKKVIVDEQGNRAVLLE